MARKPVIWLDVEIKTPPFSAAARQEAGFILGRLQDGILPGLPSVRPMPSVGRGCFELRINSSEGQWRIHLRIDPDAIVIVEVCRKKTAKTPKSVIELCRKRLAKYDAIIQGAQP